ncbi:MAG: alpha/beta fold hydrolase [Deltaproteobacteria bacterium]|nr:alpha/beta fold hydrolase [Deltaproteobacteria bacterium]
MTNKNASRTVISFDCKGSRMAGWHYPAGGNDLRNHNGCPAVVMGHGLSLTRDCGLPLYAERFAAAGMHVVVFDYRGFGESEGSAPEVVSARKQVEDYHAALKFIRKLDDVDESRIGVWGTSYSGGIATQCAYEDGNVKALVIQVPNLDNAATGLFMARHLTFTAPIRGLWLVMNTVIDFACGILGLSPHHVRAMGRKGEWAAYVNNESMDQIDQIRGPLWKNRLATRDFISWPFRPIKHVKDIRCRIQIFAAEKDDLTPFSPAIRAAKIAGARAELHRYPMGHFGIYVGDIFLDAVKKQIAFLTSELTADKTR